LVRHRIATYSQQSQRYVEGKNFGWVMPPSVKEAGETAVEVYEQAMQSQQVKYQELVELGVPKEDARFVLTNATTTRIVASFNARELMHIFSLRTCNRAQWEIRSVARAMLAECRAIFPEVFNSVGPSCYTTGKCPEGSRSCGSAELMKQTFTPQPIIPKNASKEIYELNQSELDKLLHSFEKCDPMKGESGDMIANAIKEAKEKAFLDRVIEDAKAAGLPEDFVNIPQGKYPIEELIFLPEVKFYIASLLNGDLYASELILIRLKGEMIRTGLLKDVADSIMGYLRDVYQYNISCIKEKKVTIADYTSNDGEKIKSIADGCCDIIYLVWSTISAMNKKNYDAMDDFKHKISEKIDELTPKNDVVAPYADIFFSKIVSLTYHE